MDITTNTRIVHHRSPEIVKTFAAHALHQATLTCIGRLGLQEAVDGLRLTWEMHRIKRVYIDENAAAQDFDFIVGTAFADYGFDHLARGGWHV